MSRCGGEEGWAVNQPEIVAYFWERCQAEYPGADIEIRATSVELIVTLSADDHHSQWRTAWSRLDQCVDWRADIRYGVQEIAWMLRDRVERVREAEAVGPQGLRAVGG